MLNSSHEDILIAHPYKHHILNLAAGCKRSGYTYKLVLPLYRKGLGRIIALLPGGIGKKARGYFNADLDAKCVHSPIKLQIPKLISFLSNPERIEARFDRYVERKIRRGIWKPRLLVVMQDYMPRTVAAAREVGIFVWNDQINFSLDGAARLKAHCDNFGYSVVECNEDTNSEVIGLANLVSVPSLYAISTITSRLNSDAILECIPYGVDSSRAKSVFRGTDRGDVRIVARANTISKGGHLFLRALECIGDQFVKYFDGKIIDIYILGDLDLETARILKGVKLNVRIRISYGSVPHSDVFKILANADIFVMPSLSDSMSLACMEAMQSNTVLGISKYCGIDDFVDDQMGVLFGDSVEDLSKALMRIAKNQDKWNFWIDNANDLAAKYTWYRYESTISDVVLRILSR